MVPSYTKPVELTIPRESHRNMVVGGLVLLVLVGGVWFTNIDPDMKLLWTVLASAMSVTMFYLGICGLLSRGPSIVVDQTGIKLSMIGYPGRLFMSWNEITAIEQLRPFPSITIRVTDNRSLIRRMSLLNRLWMGKRMAQFHGSPIVLQGRQFGISNDELIAILYSGRPDPRSANPANQDWSQPPVH